MMHQANSLLAVLYRLQYHLFSHALPGAAGHAPAGVHVPIQICLGELEHAGMPGCDLHDRRLADFHCAISSGIVNMANWREIILGAQQRWNGQRRLRHLFITLPIFPP